MFKEICTLIADLTGFVIGDTLQVGHRLPNAPERCILVGESGAGGIEPQLPDYADVMIQVVSRAKNYFDARDDAYVVYRALHGTAGWNMPRLEGSGDDYIAWVVSAVSIPQYIGQTENHLFEFSTNYIFRCAEASCGVESGSGSA
ncbi:MAG: minor capsid protein [Candidatus Omnitrophota bacterium]|jgi:hypothetical protein|nr:minor capsid protein [Sphaerochaeta sp.]